MARVKGGMNAKKKHNRVLKLAKGYRGARSKQYRVAKQSVMRVQTALDRSYQRSSKNERIILQQIHVWSEECRCRYEQKDACRDGCQRCSRIYFSCRTCKSKSEIRQKIKRFADRRAFCCYGSVI